MRATEWKTAVIRRDRARCVVTGEPAQEIHHILGRRRPRGFKQMPPEIKDEWPDVEPNLACVTLATHQWAHRLGRYAKRILLTDLLENHGGREWQGRPYREWLSEPPFAEFLH